MGHGDRHRPQVQNYKCQSIVHTGTGRAQRAELPVEQTMADSMGSTPAIEDQGRLLEDALGQVRQQTQMMRRLLETPGKLMDALKCRYVSSGVIFRRLL